MSSASFQQDMAALIPNLRAFAKSICGNPDVADDLVQETLVKAWKNRKRFQEGTNLKAWLFAILRNTYLSELRKRKYEVEDTDGALVQNLSALPSQNGHMDALDFQKALMLLPSEQREALILVGAEGFSCEEASELCGCAVGTIKSRVNRARAKLCEVLGVEGAQEFATEPTPRQKPSRITAI